MIKFIDVTGKTEDEAIQSALAQLKMDRDDVSVEILERAKAGFLGIGSAPARVRVSYDDGKAEAGSTFFSGLGAAGFSTGLTSSALPSS